MEIQDKTLIITGAATGIGRASALHMARAGAARLILLDIDMTGLEETARLVREKNAKADTAFLDLSDLSAVEAWFSETLPALGKVDVLYNNAGTVSGTASFPTAGRETIERLVNVNLASLVLATEHAANHFAASGGGVIVNTVSTVAFGSGLYDVLYATTKAGVHMFVKACAPLQQSHNVRVLGVLPGLTDTPILYKTGGNGVASDWMKTVLETQERCTPEDIASAVADLIERDEIPGGAWVAVRRRDGEVCREWSDPALA